MRTKKRAVRRILIAAAVVIVLAAVLFAFSDALGSLSETSAQEGRAQLELALRRAAVACYAAEGVYPQDLDYLTEHYGVQINEDRYTVFYEIFADNLMPDITVLEN